ncbi:hypothetical protein [Kribbella sandramycini]|uniref:Phytase-like domain-containing protein n=1 Tax=Kribbella sandramycini TaxID=60450 RepID=A0A841SE00_9ACTN|nr:hypothetical protein [Kribbella sandramycini]MBB6567645.1 hypothetical protein [Kribbella sandramycini]
MVVADGSNVFGTNLSGLSFEGQDVLWAVKNGPSTLYRLIRDGANWRPDGVGARTLNYRNGQGDPDAEAVVRTPDGLLVATERDGDDSGSSLLKVLRYDPKSTAKSQNASAEWDLTRDLPAVDDNSGLEAISWVPDSFLTAKGFRDERTKAVYNPASYANHGTGLYFVGLEDNGTVYAYALNQSGSTFTRVASFAGGFGSIMDLEFDPASGLLWSTCDNSCQGRSATLAITAGKFAVSATYNRPTQMPNLNNEGFAIAPTCTSGRKQVVWADDDNTNSHALRTGTLSCAAAAKAQADDGWQQIGAGMTSGVSGIAVLRRSDDVVDALVVRDNKKPGENRAIRVRIDYGEVGKVDAIEWPGELPVDLEAVEPVPGRSGEYIALASAGKGFRFQLEGTQLKVLATFQVPAGLAGDNYESFALKTVRDHLYAVWADRGQDARSSTIYSARLDVASSTFGKVRTVTFRVPYPATDVRHISDLEITADNRILITAASDPGDDGPFDSAAYVAGKLGKDGAITLATREFGRYPGHKIEALTCLSRSCDRILYGTDDEAAGGAVRIGKF